MNLIDEFDNDPLPMPLAPTHKAIIMQNAPQHPIMPDPVVTSCSEIDSVLVNLRNNLFSMYHKIYVSFATGNCKKTASEKMMFQSLENAIKEYNTLIASRNQRRGGGRTKRTTHSTRKRRLTKTKKYRKRATN